jgi:transposase
VAQRSRSQQRLRWHLHQLDPTYQVPLRRLDRATQLERVARWLARREQELQVRLARDLVAIIRQRNRTISELDQEIDDRVRTVAPALLELPGCAAITAAKLLAEIGRSTASAQTRSSPRHSAVAPLEASSGKSQRHRLDRGGNHQLNAPLYRIAITQARYHPPARDYLERKRSEGKSRREALRRLKRLLVRVVFNALKTAPGLT